MRVIKNHPLAKYTTFHIGGPAEFFAEVKNTSELKEAAYLAKQKNLKINIIGGGSNLLISDRGLKGLVLKMSIKGVSIKNSIVSAGAGEEWNKVVARAVSKNLSGIENLSLIPGTVGGAVYQNIGAYGSEVKDVLKEIRIFDIESGKNRILSAKDCRFGYRDSIFQHKKYQNYIITGATFVLSKKFEPKINYPDLKKYFAKRNKISVKDVRSAIIKIRRFKLVYPSAKIGTAGSFFKNPIVAEIFYQRLIAENPDIKSIRTNKGFKLSAGQLIEMSGWKGQRMSNTGVSAKHALVLVNYTNGKAEEILSLAALITRSVKHNFGIKLEPEVKIMA